MCPEQNYARCHSLGWNCAVFPLLSAVLLGYLIFLGKLIITPNMEAQRPISATKFHYFLKNQGATDLTREDVLTDFLKSTKPRTAYFYIHGFQSPTLEEAESLMIKDVILETQKDIDMVVLVDWCDESNRGLFTYPDTASFTVPKVAEHVTEEVKWMETNLGISRSQIKMAGHSLGAHIMGRSGELLQEDGGGKIAQMTGLDAAGPMFDDFFPQDDHRLSKGDAEFVLCIHTDDILGTTNRTFCNEDRYPSEETCGLGGFICRHNCVKKLFAKFLKNCTGLMEHEEDIGGWNRFWRWLLTQGPFRNIVITAHYSNFLAVLYSFMVIQTAVCVVSLLSCCFAARICKFSHHRLGSCVGKYALRRTRDDYCEIV